LQENFDLMTNFDFFWPNNLGFPHGMSVKLGLWTFHELWKWRKNFDFIDFWWALGLGIVRIVMGFLATWFWSARTRK